MSVILSVEIVQPRGAWYLAVQAEHHCVYEDGITGYYGLPQASMQSLNWISDIESISNLSLFICLQGLIVSPSVLIFSSRSQVVSNLLIA